MLIFISKHIYVKKKLSNFVSVMKLLCSSCYSYYHYDTSSALNIMFSMEYFITEVYIYEVCMRFRNTQSTFQIE